MATVGHLWEFEHPYYCTEGNFYQNGCHDEYYSWAAFMADWGDVDFDYNLPWRWDWQSPTEEFPDQEHRLDVFWMLQRKAICRSTSVKVSPEDEPAVREWLAERWEGIKSIWAPFSGEIPAASTSETPGGEG